MKKGTIVLLVIVAVIVILLVWKGKTIFANAGTLLAGAGTLLAGNKTVKPATISNTTQQANTPPIGYSTQAQQQNTATNNNAVIVAGINAGSNILSSLVDVFGGNNSVDNLAEDTQPSEQPDIVDNSSPVDTMPIEPDTLNTDGFTQDVTV